MPRTRVYRLKSAFLLTQLKHDYYSQSILLNKDLTLHSVYLCLAVCFAYMFSASRKAGRHYTSSKYTKRDAFHSLRV